MLKFCIISFFHLVCVCVCVCACVLQVRVVKRLGMGEPSRFLKGFFQIVLMGLCNSHFTILQVPWLIKNLFLLMLGNMNDPNLTPPLSSCMVIIIAVDLFIN